MLLQKLVQQHHVAERLRHLPAVEGQHAVVQPVAREHAAAVRAGRLRDLVLVVRKHQIVAAGVDVDRLAQMRLGHRRAFDVPAGTAAAPRAVPAGKLGRRRLPEHEIGRILLVRSDLDARAGDHLVDRAARELAVFAIARRRRTARGLRRHTRARPRSAARTSR